ncbi:MAG: TetR/AcrR family transcriptional regulator [Galbitalea sp.]
MSTPVPARPSPSRERLLRVASDLFYREGIHTVGLERVLAEANVTRATLYRHFPGKEALVLAYLGEEDATLRALFAEAAETVEDPADMVDAVIVSIAGDIERHHTRGCPFINAAAEYPDPDSPVRRLIAEHRAWFRTTLEQVFTAAGAADPAGAAASFVLLPRRGPSWADISTGSRRPRTRSSARRGHWSNPAQVIAQFDVPLERVAEPHRRGTNGIVPRWIDAAIAAPMIPEV